MNWFLAKIVYRIVCGKGEHTPQFDEQLRLIGAEDEELTAKSFIVPGLGDAGDLAFGPKYTDYIE